MYTALKLLRRHECTKNPPNVQPANEFKQRWKMNGIIIFVHMRCTVQCTCKFMRLFAWVQRLLVLRVKCKERNERTNECTYGQASCIHWWEYFLHQSKWIGKRKTAQHPSAALRVRKCVLYGAYRTNANVKFNTVSPSQCDCFQPSFLSRAYSISGSVPSHQCFLYACICSCTKLCTMCIYLSIYERMHIDMCMCVCEKNTCEVRWIGFICAFHEFIRWRSRLG